MGNHDVGNAVGPLAEEALRDRSVGESAMQILDRICSPWRNTDAEWESSDPENPGCVHPAFDSYTDPHPKAALGNLMVEAFAPGGLADLPRYSPMLSSSDPDEAEAACDDWYAEVYEPFKKRYGFW